MHALHINNWDIFVHAYGLQIFREAVICALYDYSVCDDAFFCITQISDLSKMARNDMFFNLHLETLFY